MVCCCDPFEPLGPEEANQQSELVKEDAPIPEHAPEKKSKTKQKRKPREEEELLVSVTLPPGVYSGQRIEVKSPDGSRTVDTIVPDGLETGQAFLVKFPPLSSSTSLRSFSDQDESPEEQLDDIGEQDDDDDEEEAEREKEPVQQSRSFAQALEDLLLPSPDPDILDQLQQASPSPTMASHDKNSVTTDRVSNTNKSRTTKQFAESFAPNSPSSRSVSSTRSQPLQSQHITKVEGDPVDAVVTNVDADWREENFDQVDQKESKEHDVAQSRSFVQSLEDFFTPKPDAATPKQEEKTGTTTEGNTEGQNESTPETKQRPDSPTPSMFSTASQQKLLYVQVPPGLAPGTTIYVEIPGENRTVAAQIPPNVTSFHVAYTPNPHKVSRSSISVRPTPAAAERVNRPHHAGREKLLSVRVPPGTPPGTTLHVSVPEEPGRILAAKVPPGNVRKFHVSYVPLEYSSPRANSGGMLPPANPYRGVKARDE